MNKLRSLSDMHRFIIASIITVIFFSYIPGIFAATELTGKITAKQGELVKVDFTPDKTVGPKVGDEVKFSTTIGGQFVNAGIGKVTDVDTNFVWIKAERNNLKLKMKAIIHATGLAKKEIIVQSNNAPPLHLCDELAGDPWDNQRFGPSVKFSSINANQAISACEEATRMYPATDRFSFQLGRAYTAGFQYTHARFYYLQAAIPGNYAAAQHNLGVMYHKGHGIPIDNKAALKWYLQAAEHNYAAAQNNVGFMYEKGQSVQKNMQEAIRWYKLAASQGDEEANQNLKRLGID